MAAFRGEPQQIKKLLRVISEEAADLRGAGMAVDISLDLTIGFDFDGTRAANVGGKVETPDLVAALKSAMIQAGVEGGWHSVRRLLSDGELHLSVKATGEADHA